MKITKDQLKCWKACKDGYGWFLRRFPDGEAEYQDVLNALAEDDRPADADWLMSHMINEPGFFAQAERWVTDRASLSSIAVSWATLFNIYLNMDITDKDLQAWSASDEFKLWFAHRFGDACDYQRLLERLAEEDMPEEANWLMDRAGQDRKAVLNIDCVSKDKNWVEPTTAEITGD